VQIGPPAPQYREKLKVHPNLVLKQEARISGRLIDESGAPFQDSPVELRLYISPSEQSAVARVKTDRDGQFRFKRVNAGKYRLIASLTRAFQQLSDLRCDKHECAFAMTLLVNPTDLPDSQCQVR